MRVSYKGFELTACVEQLANSGAWTTRVLITKHLGNETREKFCSAANVFQDKTEAELHSIEFGKQIVDGSYRNATTADLA